MACFHPFHPGVQSAECSSFIAAMHIICHDYYRLRWLFLGRCSVALFAENNSQVVREVKRKGYTLYPFGKKTEVWMTYRANCSWIPDFGQEHKVPSSLLQADWLGKDGWSDHCQLQHQLKFVENTTNWNNYHCYEGSTRCLWWLHTQKNRCVYTNFLWLWYAFFYNMYEWFSVYSDEISCQKTRNRFPTEWLTFEDHGNREWRTCTLQVASSSSCIYW